MRQKIVAGNWKMNTYVEEGISLIKNIKTSLKNPPAGVKIIVSPPFTHLCSIAKELKGTEIGLSAQNCSSKDQGAYTGEVSVRMVRSTGAQYVIIGHSERRQYFNESDRELLDKLHAAIEGKLIPIFCIGEKLEDRENGNHFKIVESQLMNSCLQLSEDKFSKIILAYEPVWAIGTGKVATPAQAEDIHGFIRKTIGEKFNNTIAQETTILYGGSVKPSNALEIFKQPNVDGGLIGGASLKADDFTSIINSF